MANQKKAAAADELKAVAPEDLAPIAKAEAKPVKAEAKPAKAEAKPAKAEAKSVAKAEAPKVVFAPAERHDYEVVLAPHITEKSMALLQNANKVTVKVADGANKTEIKASFQRLYQVAAADVKVLSVRPKAKSRGGRYKGFASGYKKAVVTLAKGSAIDLFKQ